MSDYKNTLNLPQTDFPMKANLAKREPEILEKWQKIGIYNAMRAQDGGKKKFILHLGPPYANGHIHLGTATTTVLKDIIVKSKTLSGFASPLVPGWDCHGLPIELNVEKKIGKAGHKVSAADFRQACRDYAASFVDIQREEFKRLGVIADWENPYLTMDPVYEANIIRSLGKIISRGHVQQGFKPVHWCLACGSALAEAEVEYAEKTSPAIDVRFSIRNVEDFWSRFETIQKGVGVLSIPIWTTTPWTLPANEAVAVNPNLIYSLVECDAHGQILVAKDLLESVMARYKIEHYRILGEVLGDKLEGITLKHPFYEKEVPVILADHVTIDAGTGAVHTAPAHGQDDYRVAQRYALTSENPVGMDGCFKAHIPLVGGVHVNKANEMILAALRANGSLIVEESIRHSYPHCWRHKTPLIFLATPQWFISMDKRGLRKLALEAVNRVEWIPDWGKSRIEGMIEGRPDWCISRQRAWGVPIVLFTHKDTGEIHPQMEEITERVAACVEKEGIDAWYNHDISTWLGKDSDQYIKTNDVLDVWFDSGVSHECVLEKRPELHFPADMVLEGSDQHRGWFQSSLLTSIAIKGVESYRAVLTHGFVVDGQGRKMSKSIGNVIAPKEVIESIGADILRLWVASVDYRTEITASKEILARTSETYRRLRNTARFLLANLHDFRFEDHAVSGEQMLALDQWAIAKTKELQAEIMAAYEQYQFHIVVQKLHQFCVTDLGGFYLDIIKDRQYTMQQNSIGRRSAQTAIYHMVHALVRWMAPILSFTAEEILNYMPGNVPNSVFLTEWYDDFPSINSSKFDEAFWTKIRDVRETVNKEIEQQRNLGKIGSSLEAEVYLYCAPALHKQLMALEDELRFVFITSKAQVMHEHAAPEASLQTDIPGLSLVIKPTTAEKCERCWHRVVDVNAETALPGLCARCVVNVQGDGEVRKYA